MLWVAVSADKFELPYAVAESARELARMLQTTMDNIHKKRTLATSGKICGYRVVTIDVPEDEIMKYEILGSFRDYLHTTMNHNTARKYYSSVKKVFKDVAFQSLDEIDTEYIEQKMKELPSKNEFSAAKRGLLKLQEYDPALQLPKKQFFEEQAKKKRNFIKSRGRKIYKDTVMRKINQISDANLRLAYRLEMVSGLRISELADLYPGDIEIADNTLLVTVRNGKGGKSGIVTCLDDGYVKERLEALIQRTEANTPLFYSTGHMMNEASRLGFECHDLRRIFSQDMEQEQINQGKTRGQAGEEVREALRHSRLRTTNLYLRGRQVIRGHPDTKEKGA